MIMTPEDQIKAIAELDGWKLTGRWFLPPNNYDGKQDNNRDENGCPNYLTSRDAIVLVIEKYPLDVKRKVVHIVSDLFYSSKDKKNQWYNGGWRVDCKAMACLFSTPPQLCEALLRATGKWIE
jgi:hypothetical protein